MNIIFFHPHRQRVSGGLTFFYELARYIGENTEHTTYIMNFKNSYINSLYEDKNLNILNYEDEYDFINDDFIFFTYVNMIPTFLQRFQKYKNAKVFIINFHISTWNILFNHLNVTSLKTKKQIVKLFHKTNSLVFMDDAGYHQTSSMLGELFNEHYLNVFVKPKLTKNFPTFTNDSNNQINIGYLGRLDNDKIFIIINLLENLNRLTLEQEIILHIIGDGNSKHLINTNGFNNIKIKFTSFLENEALEQYIVTNIDIGIAVGMAALEFAKNKIPTVISSFTTNSIIFDKFIWLQECNNKTLGADPESLKKLDINLQNLQNILQIYKNIGKEKLGNISFDYYSKNYSLEATSNDFLKYMQLSTLKISDFFKIKQFNTFVVNANYARTKYYDVNDFLNLKTKKNLNSFLFKIFLNKKIFVDRIKNDIELKTIENYEKHAYTIFGFKIIKTYKNVNMYMINFINLNIYKILKTKDTINYYILFIKILQKIYKNNNLKIRLFGVLTIYNYKKSFDNYYSALQRHYETTRRQIKQNYIKTNNKIRVGFYTLGVFSYSSLYKAMEKSNFFEPFIVIVPDVSRQDRKETILIETYDKFKQLYKNVFLGYDLNTQQCLDYSKKLDIVFFDNPYPAMAHYFHHVDHFIKQKKLTCFQNYGFFTLKYGLSHIAKQPFYNKCWKIFVDSYETYNELKIHQPLKAANCFVSGYCKMDNLSNYTSKNCNRKKILLCPHHTINMKALQISNFLKYSDFFLELPKIFPEIDFIFRPHILLFWTLKHYWGENKTEQYLNSLLSNSNVIYDSDMTDYFQNFVDSDAIIHDCGSFTAEYLFTGKPSCYMLQNKEDIYNKFLNIGQKCLENYYHAYCKEDIINFIQSVVIEEKDELKEQREKFSNYLKINYPNVGETTLKYLQDEILK